MSGREIGALGYLGLEVSDLEAWRTFASDLLGVPAKPRADESLTLRLDDYASRIRIHEGPADDLAYVGWEVSDGAGLRRLAERLAVAGVAVETGDTALAADRCVAELIRFRDPEGTQHEAFYGPLQRTEEPAVSPHGVRFKTGPQGLGHVVLSCADKPALLAFFVDLLGFRISDHINTEVLPGRPLSITFLRCNSRHHSLALVPAPLKKRLAHFMIEVVDLDDVGRAMHRCLEAGVHLSMTLGRHSNDQMLSFYPLSPSGFDVEYGWGGLEVSDESWHVVTHAANSSWGHRFQRPPKPTLSPVLPHEA